MRSPAYERMIAERIPAPNPGRAAAVDALIRRSPAEMQGRPLHRRLSSALERAQRNVSQSRTVLRATFRDVVAKAIANGEDPHRIADVLRAFFSEHPLLEKLDRVSVIDGTRSSVRVLEDVTQCLAEALEEELGGEEKAAS